MTKLPITKTAVWTERVTVPIDFNTKKTLDLLKREYRIDTTVWIRNLVLENMEKLLAAAEMLKVAKD